MSHVFYFVILFGIFIWKKIRVLFFKTKDTKKAKTEDKVEPEEGAQAPEATENSAEEPGDGEEESEVPSLPLGLTGNPASSPDL